MLSIFNEKLVITAGIFCATMVFGMMPIQLVKYLFADETLNSIASEEDSEDRHDRQSGRHRSNRRHPRHHHRHHHHRPPSSFEIRKEKRKAKLKKIISYASCFSGGVFIAACLLDLLPDVHEAFDHVLDEIEDAYHTKVDYPVAEFVIVFGFFVVLILEQIVLDCKEGWQQDEDGLNRARHSSADEHRPLLHSPTSNYGSSSIERQNSSTDSTSHQHDVSSSTTQHDSSSVEETDGGSINGISFAGGGGGSAEHPEGHSHAADMFNHSVLRSVLLIIALTFHSLFEGLAIGLQKELGELMSIFIAVVVHKAVMAFSLGLNIAQSNFGAFQAISSIFVFSISSPIGIAIGMVLANMEKSLAGDIANGILQGIAGGTFLYITFFEVLPHELNSPHNRMPKLLFVLGGYACICCLLFITH